MIKFILKKRQRDSVSGLETEDYFTQDIDVPVLEKILTSGGSSEYGYETNELVGVEITGA